MKPKKLSDDEQDFEDANRLVKRRQFFPRRPKKAADLIAQLLVRKGYGQVTAAGELAQTWHEVTSNRWRNQTQPGNIRRGVLEVVVANSALLQQLEFEKKNFLLSIQQHLPQNQIKEIRFRIGTITPNG
jgi:hypothetical protein